MAKAGVHCCDSQMASDQTPLLLCHATRAVRRVQQEEDETTDKEGLGRLIRLQTAASPRRAERRHGTLMNRWNAAHAL